MKVEVGVLGPLGTYTHQATHEYFQASAIYNERQTIAATLESLKTLDYAVVPRENSIFGSVVETFDGLRVLKQGLIQGEVVLKIQHCLVVKKGAKISDIDCVISHEQALGQCRRFLSEYLPSATTSKTTSTAAAAGTVSKLQKLNVAAICSKICVTMFEDLEILVDGIQDEDINYTRFFILGKNPEGRPPFKPLRPTHALIRVTPSKTCFDLAELLKIVDLSVKRIDRRPAPASDPFLDIYFLEVVSSPHNPSEWPEQVSHSILRIRDNGHFAESIGLW
ncbi:Prephenate dehydratase-domain-containing protein [Lentinula lateritia]|uniref:Prephenate dehydratase-domain-containing protein n=1 Tax=Lentinula aff. lateritia TaxID=2804960 RepID=A0ACC1U5M0_9AGAR|nr:Prephenate dehydratase-domain-containing protein [Lentinula aff. lateritia]KAJ3853800.1 Prephenate dehydratase-domain-containing protein [Lentinula lateritia]